jgi:hypothetical protein
MKARLLTVTACAALTTALTTVVSTDAAATTPPLTPGASAYSAAGDTGSATLQASLQLSGSLGQIVDWMIGPIVRDDLNPLLAALRGTVNGTVSAVLGSASNLNAATNPAQLQVDTAPAAFPNDTLPSPCQSSGAQPCYSATSTNVNGAPLASVGLGLLTGYVEQVAATADPTNPVFARASALTPSVSVLPGISTLIPTLPSITNPLISASAVNAKATCPNDGPVGATKPTTSPTAQESATGVTLLGGKITLGVLDGQITDLVVDGVSYPSVLDMPDIDLSGVTVSSFGQSLYVAVPLSVDQVLAGLGLPSGVVADLTGFLPTSSVRLGLVVGPNATVTSRTATAWGLGIGVDLAGSLTFNLLDLVTATVTIPTGIGHGNLGNLLDLRLAYATCQSGVNVSGGGGGGAPAIPMTLV